jgi:hypothetical protein
LSEILPLTLVRIKLSLDSGLCFCLFSGGLENRKLHVAEFADSKHRNVFDAPDDPKFSLWHVLRPSLCGLIPIRADREIFTV